MEKKNDPRRRIRQIQVPDQDIRPMEGRERKRNTSRAAKNGARKTTGTRNARTGPSSGNRLRPVEAPVKRPASKAQSRKQKARRRRRRTIGHILQAVLVVALIGVLFFVIRNFGDANKLNNKGLKAYEAGNYEEAIDYFDQALAHDGGNVDYHINKAMAQLELKLYDDVSATLDEAEARAGDGEEQLVDRARGILFLSRGNYQEAIDAFDRALDGKESRFSSRQIDILYYKAEAQDRAGLYVDAVMTYGQIIDSKASLTSVICYVNAESDEERKRRLEEHVKSVRRHVDELSAKNYGKYSMDGGTTLDFVIMFVPQEAAVQLAVSADATLWSYAFDRNVIITGEQNLFSLLRLLQIAWTQQRQADNQKKVFDIASALVQRVQLFMERFSKVGAEIDNARKAFDDTLTSVEGNRGLLVSARKLVDMGAKEDPKKKRLAKVSDD